MDKLRKKRNEISARNILGQFSGISLIEFEKEDSIWISRFQGYLSQIQKIDSNPSALIKFGKATNEYLSWIQYELDFLRNKKEWLIIVPNCEGPVWANVLISSFAEALSSLWNNSNSNEFVIADKTSGQVAVVFCEENCYELHKRG